MKTKRRHELETNQLADWLGGMVERVRPRANLILTVVVVVLVVLLAGNFLVRRTRSRGQAAWTALVTANTPTELAAVGDDYPDSPAGKWGLLRSGDLELAMGMRRLLTNREEALVNLRAAQRTYERLVNGAADSPLVEQRAGMGLAKTLEALGEIQAATEAYQAILDRYPDGLFADEAKDRLEALKDPKIAEFYAWLAGQGRAGTPAAGSTAPASQNRAPASGLNPTLNPLAPTLPLTKPDEGPTGEPEKTEQSPAAESGTSSDRPSEPAANEKAPQDSAAPALEKTPAATPPTIPADDSAKPDDNHDDSASTDEQP
jgi:hypothetical protein